MIAVRPNRVLRQLVERWDAALSVGLIVVRAGMSRWRLGHWSDTVVGKGDQSLVSNVFWFLSKDIRRVMLKHMFPCGIHRLCIIYAGN